MDKIYEQAKNTALELVEKAGLRSGNLVIIGCSTSEVSGVRIGTGGSTDVAESIYEGLISVFKEKGIQIAAQCCEHLNRAIVLERDEAVKRGFDEVCAVPHPHAGGSFATTVYHRLSDPVTVEFIKADAGLDIGGTLIGMHLKHVAVPLRLENNKIGEATVNGARTRPKYIGGERARYE
jgi:uncharacterized protein (TIGR01440 family)